MRHEKFTPTNYANEELMNELNEFMVCVKVHLFDLPIKKPKPTVEEMDNLMFRIMHVLKQDSAPFVKQ